MKTDIKDKIKNLANTYAERLKIATNSRIDEMRDDDNSHLLIYYVLGISEQEGKMIDIYQNKGRFLYRYAGSFLENATKLCFKETFPDSDALRIDNTRGQRPRKFEIDCLVENDALEIKWRDATTDGDHITKEHTRIQVISEAGYKPIRIMFYYPNRAQAIRIQETLETLYEGIGGEYYYGDAAWKYIQKKTGISLKKILEEIAIEKATQELSGHNKEEIHHEIV